MKTLLCALLMSVTFVAYSQTNYEKAWNALGQNNRTEAGRLLSLAVNDPSTQQDAYITNIYLDTYNGTENKITDFSKSFYSKSDNPYPYIYALWFNNALLGSYGKKTQDNQLQLIDKITNDDKAPGGLVAAANYQKGMHYLFSNNFDKAQKYYDALGSIHNWEYVGPFENLSESGFYKDYGPLEKPQPDAVFKSSTNADVKWITPAAEIKDGWTPLTYQFKKRTAVTYAQTFVTSPVDQELYCNVGVSGSVKVWINDELVISDYKERVTELDANTVKCNLKKGVNRILVQVGFSNSSYPNFILRFTDQNYKTVPGIESSAKYMPYTKVTSGKKYELIPIPAETYFLSKINNQPNNLLNYLLLTDVYMRSKKLIEARNTLDDALKISPDNSLIRMKLIEVLGKEDNRTSLLEEVEKIKQADPQSLVVLDLKVKELFDNEKFDDGAIALDNRIKLYGEDETTAGYKILLLVHEKKYDDLVKEAEKMYARYPDDSRMLVLMYNIKKEVYKNNKGALKIYENYIKNNFNYDVYEKYSGLLAEQGINDKVLDILKMLTDNFPYDPYGFYSLSKYFYTIKKYDKAEDNIHKAIDLAPYVETYWEQLGDVLGEKGNNSEAINAYNKSLNYDPNQYDIINKIRKLNGKSEIYKLLPQVDIDKVIKDDNQANAKNTDYGYYYILDQKDVVMSPGGATEEYITLILKITNDKGVDRYKESSIGYSNSQSLLIEKAEIVKKNGSRIQGERNDNQVVFTNLEPGDVITFRYRLQNYVYGRFEKEYWDKYYFGGQIYTATTRYNLLVPSDMKINYVFNNSSIQPAIKNVENFKEYSWEMLNPEPQKDEPLMPGLIDVGTVLHISTVPTWKEISDWYSDIINNRSEDDFEILALYNQLFPAGEKPLTEFQKAKRIYEYIEANIRYSSVSFRQSSYVPQRASTTLITRLGDCKDLSNLFVTLTHMAGISSQMVLVDTRDNGQKDMLLPSIEFNHCIAKAILDKKNYYIELTNNYLPFTSLPNVLNGAIILEIPSKNITVKSTLEFLKAPNRTRDIIKRNIDIKPEGSDISVNVKTIKYGDVSSSVRSTYLNLDKDKQMKEMEKVVANGYKNNVKLIDVSFKDLDKLNDSVLYTYNYKVRNEVSEIGSLQTFRISYPDVVASLDNFSAEKRDYPIEYWSYEDVDDYETIVNVTAPAGKKFVELPTSESFSFNGIKFSLQYTLKSPDRLVITRKFISDRTNIPAEDYPAFKAFFEKIVKAEQKFIAYK